MKIKIQQPCDLFEMGNIETLFPAKKSRKLSFSQREIRLQASMWNSSAHRFCLISFVYSARAKKMKTRKNEKRKRKMDALQSLARRGWLISAETRSKPLKFANTIPRLKATDDASRSGELKPLRSPFCSFLRYGLTCVNADGWRRMSYI